MSRDKIQRVAQRRSRGLKGCYEAELKKNNKLQGLVKIRFIIEPLVE